jgi:hypothetical protein
VGQKVLLDVVEGKIGLIEFVVAVVTKPQQSIIYVHIGSFAFHHQPYGAFVAYRGMGNLGRMQVHITGAQFHRPFLSIFLDVYLNIPFQLIEQFLGLIVVIVFSGIGPGDDHNNVVPGLFIKISVAHRGFKGVSVFLEPFIEVKRSLYCHDQRFYER